MTRLSYLQLALSLQNRKDEAVSVPHQVYDKAKPNAAMRMRGCMPQSILDAP